MNLDKNKSGYIVLTLENDVVVFFNGKVKRNHSIPKPGLRLPTNYNYNNDYLCKFCNLQPGLHRGSGSEYEWACDMTKLPYPEATADGSDSTWSSNFFYLPRFN